jgi:hypothetical protein
MLRVPYAGDQGSRMVRRAIAAPGHLLVRPRQDKPAGINTGSLSSPDVPIFGGNCRSRAAAQKARPRRFLCLTVQF